MELAKQQHIINSWFSWHFYQMPQSLFVLWKNYLSFNLHFFSIPFLLTTLFTPWKHYRWSYPKGFHVGEFFQTLVSNTFSRCMGAFIRVCLISIGLVLELVILVVGFLVILFCVIAPVLMVLGILYVIT